MNELEYAQMLEVPVSTVSVVKKKNLFKRKQKEDEELKEQVVDSVNERMGDYVFAEDLSVPPDTDKKAFAATLGDRSGRILVAEIVAACLLAVGIFLTNVFMANSAINTFIKSLSATNTTTEAAYTDFELVSVVSDLSDAEIAVSSDGVITFTSACCVYPVCDGEIASVTQQSTGSYVVSVEHTSAFVSVITGLTTVYYSEGDTVKGNIPVGYTDGSGEVSVSMYNDGVLLNCYTLSGTVPVWNS
ncbi:MAG: M23 family metallopeptidase [Clostridia bacterium]|nr:M23 family metallopeptidase [Clostridia bacterium]